MRSLYISGGKVLLRLSLIRFTMQCDAMHGTEAEDCLWPRGNGHDGGAQLGGIVAVEADCAVDQVRVLLVRGLFVWLFV